MDKRNEYIDMMRIIGCIMVICIHSNPLTKISGILNFALCQIISRIAVPFFFITSGYFFAQKLYSKDNNRNEKIKKYILKQINVYLIFSLIYSFFNIFIFKKSQLGSVKSILYFIREYLFIGVSHLWYLNALIISTTLLVVIWRKCREKSIFIFSLVCYIVGTLLNSYSFIFEGNLLEPFVRIYYSLFVTSRNALFFGFPMMTLGIIIYRYDILKKLRSSIIGLIISFVIYVIEVICLKLVGKPNYGDMYFFLVPVTFCLFSTLLNLKNNASITLCNMKKIIFYCSDLTLLVYCIHILIINIIREFFNTSGGGREFLGTCIFSILIAIVISKLKSKAIFTRYNVLKVNKY